MSSKIKIHISETLLLPEYLIKTLNHFHFCQISFSTEKHNAVHVIARKEGVLYLDSIKLSKEYLNEIEKVFSVYNSPYNDNPMGNYSVRDKKHLMPFLDEMTDEFENEMLKILKVEKANNKKGFSIMISHDVDGIGFFPKGCVKSSGVFLINSIRLFQKKDFSTSFYYLKLSIRFLLGLVTYYGFDKILEIAKKYNFKPVFFLYAETPTLNKLSFSEKIYGINPNYSLEYPILKKTIEKLKKTGAEIGIHPSFRSGNDHELFKEEVDLLESKTGQKVLAARQHCLRFYGKNTHAIYAENGIKIDTTCGFICNNAFFSGTVRPFYADIPEDLIVIPMIYMDASRLYFTPISVEKSHNELIRLIDIVKKHSGCASLNFHQRMISAIPEMEELYEKVISKIQMDSGTIFSFEDFKNRFQGE